MAASPIVAGVELKTILCTTDFSPSAAIALDYSAAIARCFGSRMLVTHVVTPEMHQFVSPEFASAARDSVRVRAEREITGLCASDKFGDVRYETQVVEGSLWPALQQVIEENDVDLIVTGTHGRTGPSKLPVGSAAEKIFRLAVKPVLSVGSLSRPVPRNQGIQRVLFTTNFSPYSDRASRYAVAIAAEFEAELIGLHAVAEGSARVGNGRSLIEDFFVQRLRKSMPPQVEWLARVRFEVVLGDAVEAILSAAGSLQADIIVMGLQSVLHSAGQLPSAIAYRTVCRAPCPVLTVRC